MGCVCSRGTGEGRKDVSFSGEAAAAADGFAGIRKNAYGTCDSGELQIKPAKAGSGKVPPSSLL